MIHRLLVILSFLLLAGLLPAAEPLPPVLAKDSLGLPYRILFQANDSMVTDVHVTEDVIHVEFQGRWLSTPYYKFADTDKNGFVVQRAKDIPKATWEALVRRLTESKGKRVTVLVFVDQGYAIRGGIPIFTVPKDRLQIYHEGETFGYPVGYQF